MPEVLSAFQRDLSAEELQPVNIHFRLRKKHHIRLFSFSLLLFKHFPVSAKVKAHLKRPVNGRFGSCRLLCFYSLAFIQPGSTEHPARFHLTGLIEDSRGFHPTELMKVAAVEEDGGGG